MTAKMLHKIVTSHDLARLMHPYKRMRKGALVEELVKYEKSVPGPASKPQATSKSKPLIKRTNKLVPGITDPLYGKGKKLVDGAREQFEKRYGKPPSPAKAKAKPKAVPATSGRPRRAKGNYRS